MPYKLQNQLTDFYRMWVVWHGILSSDFCPIVLLNSLQLVIKTSGQMNLSGWKRQ